MQATEQKEGHSGKQLTVTTVRKRWHAGIFWTIFTVGLLLQYFAPRVKIEHDAFVISSVSDGRATHAAEIVARARKMQLLSAVFTVTGALGLGFYYRVTLVRPRYR